MENQLTQLAQEYVDAITPIEYSDVAGLEKPENLDSAETIANEVVARINKVIDESKDPNQITYDFATEITLLTRQKFAQVAPDHSFISAGTMFIARSGKTIDFEKVTPMIQKNRPEIVEDYLKSSERQHPLVRDLAQEAVYELILTNSGPMSAQEAIKNMNKHFSRALLEYYQRGDNAAEIFPELKDFKGEVHFYVDASTKQLATCFEIIGVEEGEKKIHILAAYDHDKFRWFKFLDKLNQ